MERQFRVVVIDDNRSLVEDLLNYFSNHDVINIVNTFNDGQKALDYLLKYIDEYDILILDLLLPNIDGIKILEELKDNNINKRIIVLSSFKDDYTIRKIQSLNADYFLLKPTDFKILENRIMDIVTNRNEIKLAVNGDIELKISNLLHDLGIPSHVRGFKYIREGILLLYSTDNIVTLVTKDIYPKIAKTYETTSSRVERAIRHAIEISWIRGDLQLLEEIFGNSIDIEKGKPTNSEFLNTIADRLKMKRKEFTR